MFALSQRFDGLFKGWNSNICISDFILMLYLRLFKSRKLDGSLQLDLLQRVGNLQFRYAQTQGGRFPFSDVNQEFFTKSLRQYYFFREKSLVTTWNKPL
jgi:hypothetical protein